MLGFTLKQNKKKMKPGTEMLCVRGTGTSSRPARPRWCGLSLHSPLCGHDLACGFQGPQVGSAWSVSAGMRADNVD